VRHFRFFLAALLAVAALASVAGLDTQQARAASQTIGVMKSPNRDKARRTARSIDQVVIHVSEGTFWGSVRWLRNRRSHGSAHFVVSRKGGVVQLVNLSDVAWHAGNARTNARSIGIEHEGRTRRGRFTEDEYRGSARLLAYLSRRLGIRLDRRHVIGHDEVPNPYGPGYGGVDHHTDPGRHWRWGHYLALARTYARTAQQPRFVRMTPPAAPAPRPRPAQTIAVHERRVVCGRRPSVHFTTFRRGDRLASLEPWRVKVCGRRMSRVDFLVDGTVVGRDSVWPFMYAGRRGLNSTQLVNGWHTLRIRSHGRRGYRVSHSIRVRVANPLFAVAPVGLGDGQAVSGTVDFRAATNAPAKQIELVSDGDVVGRAVSGHEVEWDTSAVPNGQHQLELRATALDGRTATKTFSMLVANEAAQPETAPAPHVLWQSLADWQAVSGPVAWQVLADGGVEQVEFWVDGRLRWLAKDLPFVFGGEGGVWDAESVRPGAHQTLVRVVGTGGRIAESSAVVFTS
jgi:N-acetyl-anhydromuramyl-L-alanine amidase AmpD